MKNDVSLTLAQPSVHHLGEIPSFNLQRKLWQKPKVLCMLQKFMKVFLSLWPQAPWRRVGATGGTRVMDGGRKGVVKVENGTTV